MLAAWADLRLGESVAGLPVEVSVEPGEVTIRNATVVTVPSFTAEPVPVGMAQVDSGVRAAIRANLFPEGLNVALLGRQTPEELRVAAPLRVRGTVRVSGSACRSPASSTGSGGRSFACPSRTGIRSSRCGCERPTSTCRAPAQDPRALLAQTIRARAHLRAEAPVRPVPRKPGPDRAQLRDLRLPNESTSVAGG